MTGFFIPNLTTLLQNIKIFELFEKKWRIIFGVSYSPDALIFLKIDLKMISEFFRFFWYQIRHL